MRVFRGTSSRRCLFRRTTRVHGNGNSRRQYAKYGPCLLFRLTCRDATSDATQEDIISAICRSLSPRKGATFAQIYLHKECAPLRHMTGPVFVSCFTELVGRMRVRVYEDVEGDAEYS